MALDPLEEKLRRKYQGPVNPRTTEYEVIREPEKFRIEPIRVMGGMTISGGVSPSGETSPTVPESTQTPTPETLSPLEEKLKAKYAPVPTPNQPFTARFPGPLTPERAKPVAEFMKGFIPSPTRDIPEITSGFREAMEEGYVPGPAGFALSPLSTLNMAALLPILRGAVSPFTRLLRGPQAPPWQPPSVSEALDVEKALSVPTGQLPPTPWTQPGMPVTTPKMTEAMTGQVAKAAEESPEAILRRMAAEPERRLFRNVAEALEQGDIEARDLMPVLQREGMTIERFSELYQEAITLSGRQLQQLSRLRFNLNREVARNPALKVFRDAIEKEAPPLTAWDKFRNLYRTVDDKRRALMITQFATTARNIISQTGRYSLEVLDQSLQRGLGAQNTNAMELATSFFRQLTPKGRNQILDVLEKDPLTMAKLLANPTGELSAGQWITRTLNTFNTMQETFFRRAAFDGILRARLAQKGIDVERALANPKLIPEDVWKESVKKALELTFAGKPDMGLAKTVLKLYQEVPMLTTIQPYPRFWVNALKFQLDYSPLSFWRAANKGMKGLPTQADLSKGILGTVMLSGGMALRYNESTAGPRWYQIKTGEGPKGAKVVDMRPFAPFSTYLFLAEAIKIAVTAGGESLRNGRNFYQALQDGGMSSDDIIQGFLAMNRLGGTGLVFADMIKEGSMDRKMDMFATFVGQYLSGFTVPLRTPKDFIAGISPEEAKIRETKADTLAGKLFAPTVGNIPQTLLPESLRLPEATSSLRAEELATETPVRRQLTGVAARTITPVEEEVTRLGIEGARYFPRTGSAEFDRLIRDKMGDLVEQTLPFVIRSVGYRNTNVAGKRLLIVQELQAARRQALKEAQEELKKTNPELYKELRLKRLPEEIEAVMGR